MWYLDNLVITMVDRYSLKTITDTHNRLSDPDLTKPQMKAELEMPTWVPAVGQMIVIADRQDTLADSQRYGMFIEITDRGLYRTGSGRGGYARALTPAEIANCF